MLIMLVTIIEKIIKNLKKTEAISTPNKTNSKLTKTTKTIPKLFQKPIPAIVLLSPNSKIVATPKTKITSAKEKITIEAIITIRTIEAGITITKIIITTIAEGTRRTIRNGKRMVALMGIWEMERRRMRRVRTITMATSNKCTTSKKVTNPKKVPQRSKLEQTSPHPPHSNLSIRSNRKVTLQHLELVVEKSKASRKAIRLKDNPACTTKRSRTSLISRINRLLSKLHLRLKASKTFRPKVSQMRPSHLLQPNLKS